MPKRLLEAGWLVAVILVLTVSVVRAQEAVPAKKQLAADERAFRLARANYDPDQRLAAMRDFLKNYPKSNRADRAQNDILKILIDSYPRRKGELNAQIKRQVKEADSGQSRGDTEEGIAFQFAEAGNGGIELPRAEKLAKDAVDHLSEAVYDRVTLAQYAKYKQPAPKPEELHKQFASSRAEALAVLGEVYLRKGKKEKASPLIAEAYALDPMTDDVNTARGRLALMEQNDKLALESFESAQLLGMLAAPDRAAMMQIYSRSHGGSDAGFTEAMDARYAQLYPQPFTPEKPAKVAVGHTVLLELFTGSACPPCVGGDLAVEGVLEAYSRDEVVALAFDQHIPEPDPLTNPDSVARADFYGLEHTPNFMVDGELQPFYGGGREQSKELYGSITKVVDEDARRSTGVGLKLAADSGTGIVHAHAVVTLPGRADLAKALAAVPKTDATSSGLKEEKTESEPAGEVPEPHLMVNFALVEDGIRYSGENGIRFHRMVVRALARPAASGYLVPVGGVASLDASFDPAAISTALASYLDGYEQHNEKFGKVKFITKDMTMRPDHLAIAAWVQDTVTHHVLQSALMPVTSSSPSTR